MSRLGACLIAAVLLGTAVACSDPIRTSQSAPKTSTVAEPSETPPQKPPRVELYEPRPDEVYVQVKQPAARLVQALATYSETDSWANVASRVARRFGVESAQLERAEGLHEPGLSSRADVVYPQLGGLDFEGKRQGASIMVVLEQRLSDGRIYSRTLDVRMEYDGSRWEAGEVDSIGGESIDEPQDLSSLAADVVANPRIELPHSAIWDIYRGEVEERVLSLMLQLAEQYRYSVTVIKSGHPPHVFGTVHVSNHTAGRGVDIWEVDGLPVTAQRDDMNSSAYSLVREVFDAGDVPEIGSPWDFDQGPRSFTNDVHLDHIHLAYDAE